MTETARNLRVKLNVAHNQITQIPHTMINMPYLAELNLANNQIWELPEDFGRLAYSLTKINVSNNKLDKLPASIGSLARCIDRVFDLSYYFLVTWSNSLQHGSHSLRIIWFW